jgi:hypothetical protein
VPENPLACQNSAIPIRTLAKLSSRNKNPQIEQLKNGRGRLLRDPAVTKRRGCLLLELSSRFSQLLS